MLFGELEKTGIAFYKVCLNEIAVVIAVKIHFAENGISHIGRAHILDGFVLSEQHCRSKIEAAFSRNGIFHIKSGTFEKRIITHILPRMAASGVVHSKNPKPRKQIKPQILFFQIGKNLALRVDFLFSDVYLRDLCRCCHFHVGIICPVINDFLKSIYVTTGRNLNVNNRFSFIFHDFRFEIESRKKQGRIRNDADKILYHFRCSIFRNTLDHTFICHS